MRGRRSTAVLADHCFARQGPDARMHTSVNTHCSAYALGAAQQGCGDHFQQLNPPGSATPASDPDHATMSAGPDRLAAYARRHEVWWLCGPRQAAAGAACRCVGSDSQSGH